MLWIIPTPIGNLEDITHRAIRLLQTCDLILAEDTRTSAHLCKHYQITTPLRSYHAHNEHQHTTAIIRQLQEGKNIACISDAGTPGISDPAYLLVKACIDNHIPFSCLPGATAVIPAIVMSGLPSHHWFFEGFLPPKKGRQTRLKYLAQLPDTFVLYESPHRLIRCLEDCIQFCGGERLACLNREISKLHEEALRGTLQEILENCKARPSIKGECVLCIAGNTTH